MSLSDIFKCPQVELTNHLLKMTERPWDIRQHLLETAHGHDLDQIASTVAYPTFGRGGIGSIPDIRSSISSRIFNDRIHGYEREIEYLRKENGHLTDLLVDREMLRPPPPIPAVVENLSLMDQLQFRVNAWLTDVSIYP